ncbi:MAG: 50S ribosomal protein L21 [Solirubrobacterales bacterium]|nr:50S ribosomal protein L21 [Solirubrobacterales bacterium]
MYAIVRTGGKQYRVERGQTLLVERLPVGEGESCLLEPLLYVDGKRVVGSGDGNPELRVEARVVAHERGPKLRVVKFKPKRGYKRRTGHRQQLSRIEITSIDAGGRQQRASAKKEGGETGRRSTRQRRATGERKPAATAHTGRQQGGRARPKEEESDGS